MNIVVHPGPSDTVTEIVACALVRSFTLAQVTCQDLESPAVAVWIDPEESSAGEISRQLADGGKVVVFGRLGPRVAEVLGLAWQGDELAAAGLEPSAGECILDPAAHHDESPAKIRYDRQQPLAAVVPWNARPLCRFDFTNEWNNLGFGRIRLDLGSWSLQSAARAATAVSLAHCAVAEQAAAAGQGGTVYASLLDAPSGAALWFNRPCGPVDSHEWRVVEAFICDHRAGELPCLPYLSEVPHGYRVAVCARLDCDESAGASRAVAELYRQHERPLSLALLTGQSLGEDDLRFLREFVAQGGSVVSHSVRHEPNWGGSYSRAFEEAQASAGWFSQHLPPLAPMRYAVSPFHQNPPYAVAALADAGYLGFVGGIIANDPEYLLGRAGRVPLSERPILSFSSQSMLHGDCYRRYGNTVRPHCDSFDHHLAARSWFGYLDHPFSPRYQYGWEDEATRLRAHSELIEHIARVPDVWWASLHEAFGFLWRREQALVRVAEGDKLAVDLSAAQPGQPLAIFWKGQQLAA